MRKLIAAALFAFASATALAAGPGGPPIYNQSVAQDPSVFNVGTGTVRGPLTVQGINVGASISALNTATAAYVTRLDNLDTSTAALRSSLNTVAVDTTTLGANSLSNSSAAATYLQKSSATATYVNKLNLLGSFSATQPVVYNNTSGLFSLTQVSLSSGVVDILPVANGGTGTATPSLVQGTNVTITGTWPNQTINATAGGGGGSSSLAIFNGSQSTPGAPVSSPTYAVNGDSAYFNILMSGSTTFWTAKSSTFTMQGNTFNGASQLVQLNSSTQLPAVSGALLTNLTGASIVTAIPSGVLPSTIAYTNVANTFSSSQTVASPSGFATLFGVTAGSITANDLTASQYVKTDGNKKLVSGTISSSDLPSNVMYTDTTQNVSGNKTFSSSITVTNAGGVNATYGVVAGSFTGIGTGLTALTGANIGSAIPSSVLPSTLAYTSANQLWSAAQTFGSSITVTASQGVGVTYGVVAGSFTGIGSGLTALTAANISAGTAGINITGNAATATYATAATTAGQLAGGATTFIQLRETLQAGATAHISSMTVNTQLNIGGDGHDGVGQFLVNGTFYTNIGSSGTPTVGYVPMASSTMSTVQWVPFPSGSGTPAGGQGAVQYNNAGAFAGSNNFQFNGTSVTVKSSTTFYSGGVGSPADNSPVGFVNIYAGDTVYSGMPLLTVGSQSNINQFYINQGQSIYSNYGFTGAEVEMGRIGASLITSGQTSNNRIDMYNSTTNGMILQTSASAGRDIQFYPQTVLMAHFSPTSATFFSSNTIRGAGGIGVTYGVVAGSVTAPTLNITSTGSIKSLTVGTTAYGTYNSSGTLQFDAKLGNIGTVTLTSSVTIHGPLNPTDGQRFTFRITQDAAGSRIANWYTGSSNEFAFGADITSITLSTAANKVDYIGAIYSAAAGRWHLVSKSLGF